MKIWNNIKRKIAERIVRAWYEGGFPLLTGDRGWLPQIVQDARFDQSFVARRELLRKGRYLEMNNGIVQRILNVSRLYVIGPSMPYVQPSSSDPAWNKRAKECWVEWCRTAGINGESMSELLKVGHDRKRIDGEIFFSTTSIKPAGGQSLPRIQAIESHRVETPVDRLADEGSSIFDGLQVNSSGQPQAWWVKKGDSIFTAQQDYVSIPFSDLIHVFRPTRVNQVRGISDFFSVVNVLNDIYDLQVLEMRAAKDAAEKSTFIKTASGEIPSDKMRARVLGPNYPGSSTPVETGPDPLGKRMDYYRNIIGGRTVGLKLTEDVTQFLPQRPSAGTQWYWRYLTEIVCISIDMPLCLVFPDGKLSGPELRAALQIANTAFHAEFAIWRATIQRFWNFYFAWAIRNDIRVADPPPDWKSLKVYPPRNVTVDVGYDSAAALAELAAGVTDWETLVASRGEDCYELFDRLAKQQAYLKDNGVQVILPGAKGTASPEDGTPQPAIAPEPSKPAQPQEIVQ